MKRFKVILVSVLIFFFLVIMLTTGIGISINDVYIIEKNQNSYMDQINTEGLPQFITQEMLIAAIKEQSEHGHPASVTIAQIILESGFRRYGPGGDIGQGLSGLAYNYKNLFGMKAPAGDSTPIGVVNMQTGEEYNGANVQITAGFLIFSSYSDSIAYRSGLLERRYSDLFDVNSSADEFARGIARRWATDSQYANKLITIMSTYNLYRFDNMSCLESTPSIEGNLSGGQIRIREIALTLNDQGCPSGYCQAWVANVYRAAGQNPRQSRACATEAGRAFIVSGSKEDIPVGATVYGHSYNYNATCGNHDAGHVGIYVGSGKVVSRENKVQVKELSQWVKNYGWYGWGWNGNQDFSRVN